MLSQQFPKGSSFNKAATCIESGDFVQACQIVARIENHDKQNADDQHLCAILYSQAGRFDLAKHAVFRAITVEPEQAIFWRNLNYFLHASGVAEASLPAAERAVLLEPDSPDNLFRLGLTALNTKHHKAAVRSFEKLLALAPCHHGANLNLGVAYNDLTRTQEAVAFYRREATISPREAASHYNLGHVFMLQGKFEGAIEHYTQASSLGLNTPDSRVTLALVYLVLGHFEPGWKLYEYRFSSPSYLRTLPRDPRIVTTRPAFSPGRDLTARVLVWGEQGVGDEVMFGSMLGEFRGWCGKLLVQMDKRLIPLFRRSLPQDVEFYERGSVVSEGLYDSHIPIGSLGLHLRPSRESFEGHRGAYLKADPDRVRALRESFGLTDGERLIGVSWRSSNPETGAGRSLPLWELAQVLGGEGRRLVNLQYGSVQEEIAEAQARCGICVEQVPGLDCQNDLDSLAALIMACDEVVSIGNATAHLAGALGQKTTVLLPHSPSWRWTTVGTQTPWYQSLLLLRQHASDEWAGVLDEAQRQLVATG